MTTPTPRVRALRTLAMLAVVLGALAVANALWSPGREVRDGRHDRGANGLWLSHGWLGADAWFERYHKQAELPRYRGPVALAALAGRVRRHSITDVFPHLCPAEDDGSVAPVDHAQVERLLDVLEGVRVWPWVGGPNPDNVRYGDPAWRARWVASVRRLLDLHPRFAGVQVNVEPLRSGDRGFLALLDELRAALPPGKGLSVAAYPPPTRLHPYPDVHWDEGFFREVARRTDLVAVMMYDTALRVENPYRALMAGWTEEAVRWSAPTPVLLGVPTYDDADTGYHDPRVENLRNALLGIHAGLDRLGALPANYRGVAVYSDWETDEREWAELRELFLRPPTAR